MQKEALNIFKKKQKNNEGRGKPVNHQAFCMSDLSIKLRWENSVHPAAGVKLYCTFTFDNVTSSIVNGTCVLYNYIDHGFMHLRCMFLLHFLGPLLETMFYTPNNPISPNIKL